MSEMAPMMGGLMTSPRICCNKICTPHDLDRKGGGMQVIEIAEIGARNVLNTQGRSSAIRSKANRAYQTNISPRMSRNAIRPIKELLSSPFVVMLIANKTHSAAGIQNKAGIRK